MRALWLIVTVLFATLPALSGEARHVPAKELRKTLKVEIACARDDLEACVAFAERQIRGIGTGLSAGEEVRPLEKACKGGLQAGCARLASYLSWQEWPARLRARELADTACQAGNALGCAVQADIYDRGSGGPWDGPRAKELAARSCELGSGWGCALAAELDPTRADPLLERGCLELDDEAGCVAYADHLIGTGDATPDARALYTRFCVEEHSMQACLGLANIAWQERDEPKALRLAGAACDAGNPRICSNVSYDMELRRYPFVKSDSRRKLALEYACSRRYWSGCYNLAEMALEGQDRDPLRAADLLRRTCEAPHDDCPYDYICVVTHPQACSRLGFLTWDGLGTSRDLTVARELWTTGCNGGRKASCLALATGDALAAQDDRPDVRKRLSDLCRARVSGACTSKGQDLERGLAGPVDLAGALEAYRTACKSGDCTELGRFTRHRVGQLGDAMIDEIITQLEQGCGRQDGDACEELGHFFATGRGRPLDPEQARGWYQRACDLDDSYACTFVDGPRAIALAKRDCDDDPLGCSQLADLLAGGCHIDQDADEARRLLQRACDLGDDGSCVHGVRNGLFEAEAMQGALERTCDPADPWGCDVAAAGTSDAGAARALLEAGCRDDDGRACVALAELVIGTPDDPALPHLLADLQGRCRSALPHPCGIYALPADWRACGVLADAFEAGAGVPKNAAHAAELRTRACDNGLESACP